MAKHVYVVNSRGSLILPMENGGTRRLSPGQVVTGPAFAKFVGKGLRVHTQTPPKPKPEELPPPFRKAGQEEPEGEEEEVKGKEVARSHSAEETPPPEEPKAEAEVEEEEEAEVDSLPQSKSELEKMRKDALIELADELGTASDGTKAELVKRIAKELDL